MNNQLQTILTEQNVATENAKMLLDAFGAPFEEAGDILSSYHEIVVTDEDQFDLMAEARTQRLKLKEIRVSVEKRRKELKEDSLRTGKAIDGVAKFVKDAIEPAETYLEEQEKFGELRAAARAAEKKTKRLESLNQYVLGDASSIYNYETMTDEQFDSLLTTLEAQQVAEAAAVKKATEDRLAAEEAERKHQAEIAAENEKLKAEAEKREAAVAKERKETEAYWAKVKAEQRAAFQKETAERVAKETAERESLLAPDKEKLLSLATQIEEMTLPALASKDAQAVLTNVEELLAKVTTYIRGNVKGL